MTFDAGQKIGDYEVVAKLGAGGLGVVYEVRHVISQRREAMKILLPDQTGAADMVERFKREVQTLATLNHGNIASLHTAFYFEDQLAMVMELIHGQTLKELSAKTVLPVGQVLEFSAQTLNALVYAHRLGVVHRDIKPSNIMITESGVVKVLDFGIARTEKATDLTQTGFLVGSLNYMSPEQVRGQKATAQSDLYSLGVTIYELLTGRLPFTGVSNYEIMMGHIGRSAVPVHELAPQAPVALSMAVMRAMEKDLARRFADADEFLDAIRRVAGLGAPGHSGSSVQTALTGAPASLTGLGRSTGTKGFTSQAAAGLAGAEPARTGQAGATEHLSPVGKANSGSGLQSLPLEEISRKLAVYIGPVAKFVVKKLAAQFDDLDTIYREAAKQINSEADRTSFLRSKIK